MINIFHIKLYGKKNKCLSIEFGTRFDTLERMVGETFVILYVHPLIFLRFFLSFQKFS